jgi:hypothetical protein
MYFPFLLSLHSHAATFTKWEFPMTTLYANPYGISFTGFYFDNIDQFNHKLSQANYEEVEIEYIDGDNPRLFQTAKIHQGKVDLWFDELDQYEDNRQGALSIGYLIEIIHLDEDIKRRDEVIIYKGSIADYADEIVDESYPLDQLPDLICNHIDYDSIARDLELNSEVAEVGLNIWVVNSLEF